MRAAVWLLGVSIFAACGGSETETHSTVQVLEAANAAKDRAMVAGDPRALENFYTADYQVIDDDGGIHDRRNQVEFMTRHVDLLNAASSDVQVHMLSKNAALVPVECAASIARTERNHRSTSGSRASGCPRTANGASATNIRAN